ncbi:MAG: hypothetical protein H6739_07850 [Alphaproteobacteria bacterium]|nr:hypothetical protein [Alphaproteobacteria bacterium]
MSNGIDLNRPFPQPVPALDAVVAYLKDSRQVWPDAAGQVDEVLPWIEHLAGQVRFKTKDPLVAFALGKLALDGPQRKAFMEAVAQIDRITEEAT